MIFPNCQQPGICVASGTAANGGMQERKKIQTRFFQEQEHQGQQHINKYKID
jgi:hypothetical protein